MRPLVPVWVGYAFVVFFAVYYVSAQVRVAVSRGDDLSDHARYSEANGVRAAEHYVDHGFTSNDGLADIAYGHAFEREGSKHDKDMCESSERCVYLHTPPGTELLTGAAMRLFGKGHVGRLRRIPWLLASSAFAFLAWAMTRAAGPFRAGFVLATFAFVPMVTASMHNLAFVNYELVFLELEIGVLLLCFFQDVPLRRAAPALFAIGFFSGWISFDYVVHVCLCAMAVWLLRGDLRRHRKAVLWCTAASAGGYFLACGLHLLQVAAFLGGIRAMLDDYTSRGMARMNGRVEGWVTVLSARELALRYWTTLVGPPRFFLGNYAWTTVIVFLSLLVPSVRARVRGVELRWQPAPSLKWSFLVAFAIPFVWVVVMRQHASAHQSFVPRNFIVTFIFGALALALAADVRREGPEPPSGELSR